jgi:hypothetical protein
VGGVGMGGGSDGVDLGVDWAMGGARPGSSAAMGLPSAAAADSMALAICSGSFGVLFAGAGNCSRYVRWGSSDVRIFGEESIRSAEN